ncbi:MAG TPA: cbb3-type cytochrome c oxidase N-terminal domain-containing protein [Opitutaceae bacterium]|nr:cbb3-type cytochrome c oxidase N-terminal domain-containing protein [Opitutaceae bacterium]
MFSASTPPDQIPPEDSVRPHVYDGIQEYNKRLPNWWLFTLYITIVFWVGYWAYYQWFRVGPDGPQRVTRELAKIETAKLAAMASVKLDDATLWQMSRNPAFVDAGKATFQSTCASCHLASLRGKSESPAAVGPDLTDTNWIHGGRPMEVLNTVTNGVLVKGMPTWGPVLGQKKITEVVAYVLSHHHEGEPVVIDAAATAPPKS